MQPFAPAIVRWGMAMVFAWFGSQQLLHTADWTAFVPDAAAAWSPLSVETMVRMNGIFEIVFGALLALGLFTRPVAFLLTIHLFGIAGTLGYNAIAIRDFGLALATLSVFFFGADAYTIDARRAQKS